MNNFLFRTAFLLCLAAANISQAQPQKKYDLSGMLKNNRLTIPPNQKTALLTDDAHSGISVTGIIWLKGINFSTGIIDVDIRGKDVFQQSFVGVAFHGVDTITYEGIYFRPFNFQSADTLRKKHTVQYISQPDFPWDRLRKEHPLVYENAVNPFPMAAGWFHARIVVTDTDVEVYVNQSPVISLKVKRLSNRGDGLIGLWSSALSGDFANLAISPSAN